MVAVVLETLAPQPGEIAVDCTLGYGGHARELLRRLQPGGLLLGLDVDPLELPKTEARMRALGFGDEVFRARRSNFAGLARALAVDPPILLMDEPFGALDPVTRAEVRREFVALQKRLHKTVIIVTHDMSEAFFLGQRVGVIDAGQLVVIDTPARVSASSDPRVRPFIDTLPQAPSSPEAM
jgi:ABC-type uncharacterized transport system ATPase subunit